MPRKWLGRLILAFWLSAVLTSAGDPARADPAPPRAIIALFETARLSLPQGPLPRGLRFVLYDDGQVITRIGPSAAEPDPAGRGVAYGLIERDAAESLRRAVAADLKAIAQPQSGLAAAAEVGSTILEVWDGARTQRFSADAWPCAMAGRVFTGGWQRNRDSTDAQFLKVCDRLLQYQIAAPRPWQPRAVTLMLGATEDPPAQEVPWPKEWPAAPSGLKPKAAVAFCAPVSTDPNAFSQGLVAARWGDIGQTALVIDAGRSAVIWDWYFDLPAVVPLIAEDGTAEPVGRACP